MAIALKCPDVLTKNQWDKKKGVLAKIAVGKTDVGAQLLAIEQAVTAAGFNNVAPFSKADPVDFKAYADGVENTLKTGATTIVGKLKAAKVVATAAHSDFERNKLVPKDSTKYVKSIIDELPKYEKAVGDFPAAAKAALKKEYLEKIKKDPFYQTLVDAAKDAKGVWEGAMTLVATAGKTPTVANVQKVFANACEGNGHCRRAITMLRSWGQTVGSQFPKLAKAITSDSMDAMWSLPWMQDFSTSGNNGPQAVDTIRQQIQNGKTETKAVQDALIEYNKSLNKSYDFVKHVNAAKKYFDTL